MSNNSPTYSTNHEYVEVYSRNRHAVESDRSMFRESKPGFSEVMKLVESVRGNYPASPEIQVALRDLYQQHQLQHIEEARAQGQSKKDAIKSDPWKGFTLIERRV